MVTRFAPFFGNYPSYALFLKHLEQSPHLSRANSQNISGLLLIYGSFSNLRKNLSSIYFLGTHNDKPFHRYYPLGNKCFITIERTFLIYEKQTFLKKR
jgi:hypothetical protein